MERQERAASERATGRAGWLRKEDWLAVIVGVAVLAAVAAGSASTTSSA